MTSKQTTSQTAVTLVAMGLVAVAAAVALHLHMGLPGPVAATGAFAAFLMLVSLQILMWRSERRTSASRGLAVDDRAMPLAPPPALGPASLGAGRGPRPAPPQSTLTPPAPAPAPQSSRALPPVGETFGARRTRDAAPPTRPQPAPQAGPPPIPPRAERSTPPPLPSAPRLDAGTRPPAEGDDGMQDYWSFRPSNPSPELPPFVTGRVPAPHAAAPAAPSAPQPATPQPTHGTAHKAAPPPLPQAPRSNSPREADVEVIQDAIKRLLDEVNAAELQQESARAGQARGQRAPTISPSPAAKAPPQAEAAIDRSIEALRMTAGTMRQAFGQRDASLAAAMPPAAQAPAMPPPLPSAQPKAAEPPLPPYVRGAGQQRPVHPADARARQMADAISAGRIDVSLEPILGLEDQQTRHYEVSVRLRDADGNPLELAADGPDLRGTGLLPLFDGVRIARTAAVARRLEERGKAGSVFSAFSGESVADEHFLGELAETLHQRGNLVSQLVLSFTQGDVRAFSTPEWDSLADMRALGFRFAMSALTDLDMDFEALAEQGFAFVKLDASVFLDGLPAPSGRLPSSDVCRHLAQHGLTLVVEHIDNEDKLARVFGFGVLLGQGQLFGGARPVRADVATGSQRSATAAA